MKEIKRDDYLEKLISRKENGLIKVITGIRRCGKSYLLRKLFYKYLLKNNDKNHCQKVLTNVNVNYIINKLKEEVIHFSPYLIYGKRL